MTTAPAQPPILMTSPLARAGARTPSSTRPAAAADQGPEDPLQDRRRLAARGRRRRHRRSTAARPSASSASRAAARRVTAMTVLKLMPMPPGKIVAGQVLWQGRDLVTRQQRGDAARPRQGDRDHLPGADDLAEPGLQRRRADRREPAPARGPGPQGGDGPRGRDARAGPHPDAAAARQRLPAPVLGRHAPARDDRDRARLQPASC